MRVHAGARVECMLVLLWTVTVDAFHMCHALMIVATVLFYIIPTAALASPAAQSAIPQPGPTWSVHVFQSLCP